MTDLRQTQEYSKYMQTLGWKIITTLHSVVNQRRNYIYLKKIPLMGSVAKLQRPGRVDFRQIKRLIKTHKISVFYIEPSAQISNKSAINGFKFAKSTFLPSKTIHIDLTKPEDRLLKEMKPKTRYNIGLAKRRGVLVKESADIDAFINLWKSSARRRLALPQSNEIRALSQAFGKKARLLLAYSNNPHVRDFTVTKPIAGMLTARSPDTAFYMYAASNKEGKKLFGPTLVAWEAIRLAQKGGCKTFDFEGIYDERYPSTKPWRGFTKFKEGFGGKVVEFPKTLLHHSNIITKILF